MYNVPIPVHNHKGKWNPTNIKGYKLSTYKL